MKSALCADNFQQKVDRLTTAFRDSCQKMLTATVVCDKELASRGVNTPAIAATTRILERMNTDNAWRDLSSRSTRTQEQAMARLNKYLTDAQAELANGQQQLSVMKKAEYDAWARANPEAARQKKMDQQITAAWAAAANAQRDAQIAQGEAQDAQHEAQQARYEASEAQNQARRAQGEAARAKDEATREALFRH